MNLSDEGAAFIAAEEGAIDHWYLDQTGHWTIGIGHLWDGSGEFFDVAVEEDGRIIGEGRRLSDAEMWALFRVDAARYVEAVNRLVTVPLTQRQFDMLVDFAFNWGIGEVSGFPASSVLRLVNEGDFAAVAVELVDGRGPATPEFPTGRRYDKNLEGVRNRRKKEAAAFVVATGGRSTMKLVTRAEWEAREPGYATGLDVNMVTIHWEGPDMFEPGGAIWDHSLCAGAVRGFQAYHMDIMGWSDIAYNAVVCPHGYVFEGRGRGVRSAANGTTTANGSTYAICYMGGEGDTFTAAARDGINDAAEWLVPPTPRSWGVHQDWVATACPGNEITGWVRAGHPRASAPTPKEDELFSQSPIASTHIVAAHSGLLLTSTGDTHGSLVVQEPANGSLNQRWQMVGHEDGTVSYVNRAGDLALDRPDYRTDLELPLQVARTEYNAAQRWQPEELAPRLSRLWVPGTNRCIDIRMASMDAGATAQLWVGQDGYRHQEFVFALTV